MAETKQEVKHTAVRIKATVPKGVKLLHDQIAIGTDGENLCYAPSRSKAELIVRAVNNFEGMLGALEAVRGLFSNSSPFYIKKLGTPITNGDQERIDRTFIALDDAIRAAKQGR